MRHVPLLTLLPAPGGKISAVRTAEKRRKRNLPNHKDWIVSNAAKCGRSVCFFLSPPNGASEVRHAQEKVTESTLGELHNGRRIFVQPFQSMRNSRLWVP